MLSLNFRGSNKSGCLSKILSTLSENNIDVVKLESKHPKFSETPDPKVNFIIDIRGDQEDSNVKKALSELREQKIDIKFLDKLIVPWFPTKLEDFDQIGKTILGSGDGIQEVDHPGFNDTAYRKRRSDVVHVALSYKLADKSIPTIDYNQEEVETWDFCWQRLKKFYKTNACDEFNWTIDQFIKQGIFRDKAIPQLDDISNFLK